MTASMQSADTLPTSDVDPFSHVVLEDPLPMHEALREAGPVVYLERYNVYALTRYEPVRAALVDWQNFQSGAGVGLANVRGEKPLGPPALLEADPPLHDAPRRVLSKILGPRALHKLRQSWAAAAEDVVNCAVARQTVDAVPTLTEAFPLKVFPDAIGLPTAGRENLLPFSDHAFNTFGPNNDLVQRGAPRFPELASWVASQCTRDALTDDGFGAAIWAMADRGEVTAAQAPTMVRPLLAAGVDTTINGLSAVLYAFATHPEQWQRLREQPTLARIAFDEAVRWESPVQTFFRTTTSDVRLGDVVIPIGQKVLMFLAAANRDPRRWKDPDRFDLTRDPSGHVGFGFGIHQCVGQHIARLEAECLLTALARKVARIELTGPVKRHHNNTLRAWESIPIRLVPA
jgi:cytochrome P450